ncbi:MAG: hypothetical protein WB676_19080 [Bryobacteraceae bacterium]
MDPHVTDNLVPCTPTGCAAIKPYMHLGITRFPTDDTIRNLFRRFGMGEVHQLYAPLTEWQIERLPGRAEGYSLDLDSTVFERYGQQEGSLKGHNPRKLRNPVESERDSGRKSNGIPVRR